MQTIYTHLILLSPMLLELLVIDDMYWKKNLSDKPGSTIVRGYLMVIAALIVQIFWRNNFIIMDLFLSVAYFFLLFNPLMAIRLGRLWDYLGNAPFDRMLKKIPSIPRLGLQILVFMGMIILYYYSSSEWFGK